MHFPYQINWGHHHHRLIFKNKGKRPKSAFLDYLFLKNTGIYKQCVFTLRYAPHVMRTQIFNCRGHGVSVVSTIPVQPTKQVRHLQSSRKFHSPGKPSSQQPEVATVSIYVIQIKFWAASHVPLASWF